MTYHDMAPGHVLALLSMPLESKARARVGPSRASLAPLDKRIRHRLSRSARISWNKPTNCSAREQTALFIDAPDYIR